MVMDVSALRVGVFGEATIKAGITRLVSGLDLRETSLVLAPPGWIPPGSPWP